MKAVLFTRSHAKYPQESSTLGAAFARKAVLGSPSHASTLLFARFNSLLSLPTRHLLHFSSYNTHLRIL